MGNYYEKSNFLTRFLEKKLSEKNRVESARTLDIPPNCVKNLFSKEQESEKELKW